MWDILYNVGQVFTFFVMIALLIWYARDRKTHIAVSELVLYMAMTALIVIIWPFAFGFVSVWGMLYGITKLLNWGK
jgi:hypothetical protein